MLLSREFNIGTSEDYTLDPNGEIDPDLNLLDNRFPDAQYMAPTDVTGNFTKYKKMIRIVAGDSYYAHTETRYT